MYAIRSYYVYTYNKDGALEPAFADSYEVSEDGLTYTFTLKDGLKWSDGSDLTAADFEYSWKRAANPDTAADYAYLFDIIAKGDDGLVVITSYSIHYTKLYEEWYFFICDELSDIFAHWNICGRSVF